ncbi:hypothetical protein QFZ91_006459 [Paraburkholderia sp. JPY419]
MAPFLLQRVSGAKSVALSAKKVRREGSVSRLARREPEVRARGDDRARLGRVLRVRTLVCPERMPAAIGGIVEEITGANPHS